MAQAKRPKAPENCRNPELSLSLCLSLSLTLWNGSVALSDGYVLNIIGKYTLGH